MHVVLVMFRADGERRSFSITRDITVIGRREECDFRIPLGEISRKHCRLVKGENGLSIEDLGSSNGTFCNGQRVQKASVRPGDTVQLGSVVFVVQIDGFPADDDLAPMTTGAKSTIAPGLGDSAAGPSSTAEAVAVDEDFDPMDILGTGNPADSSNGDKLDFDDDVVVDLNEKH